MKKRKRFDTLSQRFDTLLEKWAKSAGPVGAISWGRKGDSEAIPDRYKGQSWITKRPYWGSVGSKVAEGGWFQPNQRIIAFAPFAAK